jgi:hypothetical protein
VKAMTSTIDDHGVRYQCLMFVCPGCALDGNSGLHILPVNTNATSPSWTWDGNLDAPTIEPSILTNGREGSIHPRCHSFLRAGVFEFLSDCEHAMAGQRVPMPDLPTWVTEKGG